MWETYYVNHSFDITAKILENKEIGTIGSWGPFFRISFDLIIHSLDKDVEWTSLLAFRGNRASCDNCKIGDRVPVMGLLNNSYIQFSNTVENVHDYFYFDVQLNHWYRIIIEQKSVNGKVIKVKINSIN